MNTAHLGEITKEELEKLSKEEVITLCLSFYTELDHSYDEFFKQAFYASLTGLRANPNITVSLTESVPDHLINKALQDAKLAVKKVNFKDLAEISQ